MRKQALCPRSNFSPRYRQRIEGAHQGNIGVMALLWIWNTSKTNYKIARPRPFVIWIFRNISQVTMISIESSIEPFFGEKNFEKYRSFLGSYPRVVIWNTFSIEVEIVIKYIIEKKRNKFLLLKFLIIYNLLFSAQLIRGSQFP